PPSPGTGRRPGAGPPGRSSPRRPASRRCPLPGTPHPPRRPGPFPAAPSPPPGTAVPIASPWPSAVQEGLEGAVGAEEVVDTIVPQGIVVVIGAVGVQGSHDGLHTGVGDGSGGQALVLIGVVGALDSVVILLTDDLPLRQDVLDGGVDIQVP